MLVELLKDLQLTSMLSEIILALTVFVSVYCVYAFHKRQDFSNIPPGPKPWPLLGNLGGFLIPSCVSRRFAGKQDVNIPKKPVVMSPQVGFMELAKLYGNVYSIFIGNQLVVVLNGYDVVKDALSNHADVFSDRPDIPAISIMTKRKGIVFAPYGRVWRQQRKFCHAKLRGFGFGTLSLEPSILQGLAVVKSELLRLSGENGNEGVDLTPMISNAVSNVICSVSLGQRFHHEDREFRTLLDLMARGLEISVNSPAVLINVFPFLYHFPFGVFRELRRVESDITAFLKDIIVKHKETLDPANPRDLIDMYLVEIQAQESSGEGETSFSEDYLFYIIGDLFVAGTDTTTNSILWILLYMVLYPEVQGRVQAEMDQVLGPGRPPSLSDRGRLPYTEATIMEVQRMTVVVPLAIPHMASYTTEFRGYTIPKGTVIVPNLWSVHRDPAVWDQPDLFNPGRFLDDQGQLHRTEHFMPFGIGRRVCMGEQLAKMELFLMITSLLQAFCFSLPPGKTPPSLDGRFGLTLAPGPYTVCVAPRH